MNSFGLPSGLVRVEGGLDLVRTPTGLRARRLPAWAYPQALDPFLEFDVAAAAGVRLSFATESSVIGLTLRCNALELEQQRFPAAVDLIINGRFAGRQTLTKTGRIHFDEVGDKSTVEGAPTTVMFEQLPAGEKQIELWLPHTAACEVLAVEADRTIHAPPPDHRPVWVHHGSSISHCLEAPGPSDTWPARVALALGMNLVNLGFAGQALVDPLVARAIRETPADTISLKLGVNVVGGLMMRERTFRSAVEGFIDIIREGNPHSRLVMVSAIHSPRYENAEHVGDLSLARSREVLAEIVARRQPSGEAIEYLDGRSLLGPDESADLPDGLHPSPAAYLRMADRFVRYLTTS